MDRKSGTIHVRILLVEDDESIADAVAVLTKQHYVVDIAADGQVGWEFAAACDYDLIMLDVMLPKLDGISLCRQLRRREGYRFSCLRHGIPELIKSWV